MFAPPRSAARQFVWSPDHSIVAILTRALDNGLSESSFATLAMLDATISISCRLQRAARINPTEALRIG